VNKESVSHVIRELVCIIVGLIDGDETDDEPIDFEFYEVELVTKIFLIDSIGLRLEIFSLMSF